MYTIKTISLLALAGSALAAPQRNWGNWRGNNGGDKPVATQTDVAVVTAYTTVTYLGNFGGHQPTATAAPEKPEAPEAPAPSAPAPSAPAAPASSWTGWSSSAVPEQPKPSAPASSEAPAPAPSAPSTGGGYMDVVSQWRSKMGLSALTEDSTLAANAAKTARDGNGEMKHELNPGSMAQVLAPGSPDEFEKVYVGGWLCEVPSAQGLDGICDTMSAGWNYAGQTGHADILSSGSYTKIGCGCETGIWACDLA